MVNAEVTIPVIAHGGAARILHIVETITSAGADAVAIASMLHYAALNNNGGRQTGNYEEEGNIEFLKKNSSFKVFGTENLTEIKQQLVDYEIPLRILG